MTEDPAQTRLREDNTPMRIDCSNPWVEEKSTHDAMLTFPTDNPSEFWRQSKGSARLMRWVSLLYSGFFFIEPYFSHSLRHWLWFGLAYAVFLALYIAIPNTEGSRQRALIGCMFVLAFVYYPFNSSASGLFVYPVVMLAFMIRSIRTYLIVLAIETVAICAQTLILHLSWWSSVSGIFFCFVIGLSNMSYSRQQRAAFQLGRANDEIEHLAQVAERERIARDLHDLLGHTLTVIAIKSELANRILSHDPERAAQEMRDVEQTARKALAEVREAVSGYRSEGFETEIARARRTLLSAEVQLTTSIANVTLQPAQANILCLALREAVTNIVRHAHASACNISLSTLGNDLQLAVEDNGEGISREEGNGLAGMRERVRAAGGMIEVGRCSNADSGTGAGTRVAVVLPQQAPTLSASAREREIAPLSMAFERETLKA